MSKIKQLFEPKRNRDDTSVTSLAKFFRNILDQTNVDLDGLYALIDSWMDDLITISLRILKLAAMSGESA